MNAFKIAKTMKNIRKARVKINKMMMKTQILKIQKIMKKHFPSWKYN